MVNICSLYSYWNALSEAINLKRSTEKEAVYWSIAVKSPSPSPSPRLTLSLVIK